MKIKIDGKEHDVDVEDTAEDKCKVTVNGKEYQVEISDEDSETYEDISHEEAQEKQDGTVKAPFPGTITAIIVKKGEEVEKGQLLMILTSMKMENEIHSPVDGTVQEIQVETRQSVSEGDILLLIKPDN